jgi:penicillin G amidase
MLVLFRLGGDGTTIFNTEYKFSKPSEKIENYKWKPFQNNLGPSMRFIYNFENEFHLILTSGQSGNVMSNHYQDMTNYWQKGKYMKISTDENLIKANGNKLFIIKKK